MRSIRDAEREQKRFDNSLAGRVRGERGGGEGEMGEKRRKSSLDTQGKETQEGLGAT